MSEKTEAEKKAAYDALFTDYPPHPTDGMTEDERNAYYERRRQERWDEAHDIEARVPGLDWGSDATSWPPYGNGCPWQADGWLGHRPFYARLRGNTAAMTIYDKDSPRDARGDKKVKQTEIFSCVVHPYFDPESEEACGGYAGTLNGADEIVAFFERVIPELAPTSEENPSHLMQMRAYVEALTKHMATQPPKESRQK